MLHATALRIPVVEVEGGTLTSLAGFDGHQGVALVVEPRRWATLDEVIARARERGEPPFVLVLDSLEDPQNVGTLLRSAEACGVHGVLFPIAALGAASAPAAVKASAGAVEHLLLVPLDDLGGGPGRPPRPRPAPGRRGRGRAARVSRCRPAGAAGARRGQRGAWHLGRASGAGSISRCGSRCAARWRRSTPRWLARCCCSRRPRSAASRVEPSGAAAEAAAIAEPLRRRKPSPRPPRRRRRRAKPGPRGPEGRTSGR